MICPLGRESPTPISESATRPKVPQTAMPWVAGSGAVR